MNKPLSKQLFFTLIILAFLSGCSGPATVQIPTAAPALPSATSIPLPTPTTAPALPTATSISVPTATTAPALPTATSIPLPTATTAPALPTATSISVPTATTAPAKSTATSIPLPSPTTAATATSSTTASAPRGQIVFWDNHGASNYKQIYIEQADGSNVRLLVKPDYGDDSPSLSPDGRTVVFSRYHSADINMIFVVNVDGTHLHQLNAAGCVKPCLIMGVEGHPWSPDGKQIVYNRAVADASGQCCVEVAWWVMKADGSGAHRLWVTSDATDDHYVEWSPDGKRFVFTRIDQTTSPVRSALFTMATDGSDLKQITPWELNAADQAWSPDGTLIVFQSPTEPNQGGVQNIYTIHPDGTGLIQLTKYTSADGSSQGTFGADWSPDGSQIVFSHFPSMGGTGDLFVMNSDGSGLHLLAHTDFNENNPDWGRSPTP